ncbi:hypothetical protein chiPu_0009156 [Chiloscyllium punctatum]|uniref:Uncharacterized protein n=1 Tax=Chiloscyllium punctatum TaxID=137246 RepID=A0A401SJW9_CHIPU|nr:hypothetical protein [Chiloscyllium punctatum]
MDEWTPHNSHQAGMFLPSWRTRQQFRTFGLGPSGFQMVLVFTFPSGESSVMEIVAMDEAVGSEWVLGVFQPVHLCCGFFKVRSRQVAWNFGVVWEQDSVDLRYGIVEETNSHGE